MQWIKRIKKSAKTHDQNNNVISLFPDQNRTSANHCNSKENQIVELEDKSPNTTTESMSFDDIIEKNKQNKNRLAKERANNNKGVLRSYQIKKNK